MVSSGCLDTSAFHMICMPALIAWCTRKSGWRLLRPDLKDVHDSHLAQGHLFHHDKLAPTKGSSLVEQNREASVVTLQQM